MLNVIWPMFLLISILFAIISGNIEKVNLSILNSSKDVVELIINLVGTMSLWSGIMKIAYNTSLIEKLAKYLEPFINFLFPDLKKNKKIKKEISMNMIANILGLGNAATPLGLQAMNSMQEENKDKDVLSDSMVMFIVINTASIQIIPTTVIAIRNSMGSINPTYIVFPVWIATFCAACAGISITKILCIREKRRR